MAREETKAVHGTRIRYSKKKTKLENMFEWTCKLAVKGSKKAGGRTYILTCNSSTVEITSKEYREMLDATQGLLANTLSEKQGRGQRGAKVGIHA